MPSINATRRPPQAGRNASTVKWECWALRVAREAATYHPLHEVRAGHAYLHAKAYYEEQVGDVKLVRVPRRKVSSVMTRACGFGATEDRERHLVCSWTVVCSR